MSDATSSTAQPGRAGRRTRCCRPGWCSTATGAAPCSAPGPLGLQRTPPPAQGGITTARAEASRGRPSDPGLQPHGVATAGAVLTCARPTRCWRGSSTSGRTSTRGGGFFSCRRWTCTARCCSRSPGSSCRSPATRRTLARIEDLFGGQLPAPAQLLAVDPGKLREAGLSWRKVGALRDLAERLTDGRLNQDALSKLPDDDLIAELTTVPGIGPWTVQGALLIALAGTSSCRATWPCARPSWPPITSTTSPPSKRSSTSPTNGGPTAVWPPAACSPPPTSRPRHHRSPSTGTLEHERRLSDVGRIHDVTSSSWGCEDCLAQGRRAVCPCGCRMTTPPRKVCAGGGHLPGDPACGA